MKNKYVFILCPHYQGSTIILNLLNSSNKVSSFSHINKVGESFLYYSNEYTIY